MYIYATACVEIDSGLRVSTARQNQTPVRSKVGEVTVMEQRDPSLYILTHKCRGGTMDVSTHSNWDSIKRQAHDDETPPSFRIPLVISQRTNYIAIGGVDILRVVTFRH
jgi:hypothetical protein